MASDDRDVALIETQTADSTGRGGAADVGPLGDSGRFSEVTEVGRGGMGAVYAAFDAKLERRVALKVLHAERASPDNRARLLREARAMAKLSHANVLTVFEVGTIGERDYIATELIDGGNLADWLRGEDRSWRQRLQMLVQAGRGLEAAHRAGLIHRDFKPANVLMSDDGRVLVSDFGLARLSDHVEADVGGQPTDSDADTLTRTGSVVGTPLYMSPEQHDARNVDARTDQFSFCVAAYQALFGALPFRGDSLVEVRQAIEAGPAEPTGSEVPPRVFRALARGMSVDPDDRFDDMAALLAELEQTMQPRRAWRLAAGGVGVVVVGVVALVALRPSSSAPVAAKAAGVCDTVDAQFESAWNPQRAASLRDVFSRYDSSGKAFVGFSRAVDSYRRRWTGALRDACDSRGDRGEDEFHLTLGCLLGARNNARSFLAEFGKGDRAMIAGAAQSTRELTDPSWCQRPLPDGRRLVKRTPGDTKKREAVRALRRKLAAVQALRRSDRKAEAIRRAAAVVAEARKLGDGAVLSDALVALAHAYESDERVPEARKALRDAVQTAEIGNHSAEHARALIDLAWLEMRYSSSPAEARMVARRARAALQRTGSMPLQSGRLHLVEAHLDVRRHDHAQALKRATEAKLIFERLGAPFGKASAYYVMAQAERDAGRYDYALAYFRKRLALLRREASADLHERAMALENVAAVQALMGKFDTARATYQRARALWSQTPVAKRSARALAAKRAELRTLRGTVVDAAGKPVAGAEVVGSTEGIWGNAKFAMQHRGVYYDQYQYVRRARSDASGRFALHDVPRGRPYFIAAEHNTGGRSSYRVVKGAGSVQLRLRPFGSIEGRVIGPGARPAHYHLHVVSAGYDFVHVNRLEVQFGKGERFRVDRIPAGEHVVQLAVGENGRQAVIAARSVMVAAGKTTRMELKADFRGGTLDVYLEGRTRGAIGGAVAGLLAGHTKPVPRTGDQLLRVYAQTIKRGRAELEFAARATDREGYHVRFNAVKPGPHLVCGVGFSGDLRDPRFFDKIRAHPERVPVSCKNVTLKAGDNELRFRLRPTPRLD